MIQRFPALRYLTDGRLVFWKGENGRIETTERDRFDVGSLVRAFAKHSGDEQASACERALGLYEDLRNSFFEEMLEQAREMSPLYYGQDISLKRPYARSQAICVEKVCGTISDKGVLGWALLGFLLKSDGTPGETMVLVMPEAIVMPKEAPGPSMPAC